LIVHDGGRSVVEIRFCPWCGCRLPNSKRNLWFEELARRGILDPDAVLIPATFESDRWWRESTPEHSPPARSFLNVDLDIETMADPRAFVDAMASTAYSLERPPGRASFELAAPADEQDPAVIILEFARAIGNLSGPGREFWNRAARRSFDIGLQSHRLTSPINHRLPPEVLRAAAELEAEVAITLYGLLPDDEAG